MSEITMDPSTVRDIASFVAFDNGEVLKNLKLVFPTSAAFRANIKEINKAAIEAVPKESADANLLRLPPTRSPYYDDKPEEKQAVQDVTSKYRLLAYASVRQLERRLYDQKSLSKTVNSEKLVAQVKAN
jgi:hypothetical protein